MADNKANTEKKLLDLEMKSMKDNHVFYGIQEVPADGPEDCQKIVQDIIHKHLEITEDLFIDNAYRPFRRNASREPRPIIATFQ